jgi:hypothetical protein
MKSMLTLCALFVAAGVTFRAAAASQEKKLVKSRVIVLIKADTRGLEAGANISQIDVPDRGARVPLKNGTTKGEARPRLVGQYVGKSCTIVLQGEEKLEKRQVLVAIEVGKQTLEDLRYVETCDGEDDTGKGKWHAFTAEYTVRIEDGN